MKAKNENEVEVVATPELGVVATEALVASETSETPEVAAAVTEGEAAVVTPVEKREIDPAKQEQFAGFRADVLFILRRKAEKQPEILTNIPLLVKAATMNAADQKKDYRALTDAAKVAAAHKAVGQYHAEKRRAEVARGVVEAYLADAAFNANFLDADKLAVMVREAAVACLAADAPRAKLYEVVADLGDKLPSEGLLRFVCGRHIVPAHKAEWEGMFDAEARNLLDGILAGRMGQSGGKSGATIGDALKLQAEGKPGRDRPRKGGHDHQRDKGDDEGRGRGKRR